MDVAGGILSFGLDFVPAPGLKPAFTILKAIWDCVQKASKDRRSLRNLAVFSTDVFTAVNHVLAKGEIDDHIRRRLLMFENVLEDIRDFAEKHVNKNLFKFIFQNVDVEGTVIEFQTRLQGLSMAFSIDAYGDIIARIERLHGGQGPLPDLRGRGQSSDVLMGQTGINHTTQILINHEPQRVKITYSESCQIEIRNSNPVLASRYDDNMELSRWGVGTIGSTVIKEPGKFVIVSPQGVSLWKWTLTDNRITSYDLNPAYSDWKDSIDIIFLDVIRAAAWFSWLQEHASNIGNLGQLQPSSDQVKVRTTYHSWIQRISNAIRYRRSRGIPWSVIVGGHAQSAEVYKTHFTYVSANTVAFAKVYRSGDTIVHERSVRVANEEPTNARRFCFESEEEANAWYRAWKNCAVDQAGKNVPIRVRRTLIDPRTVQVFNRDPVLGSALWPAIRLCEWGLQKPKSSVSHSADGFTIASVTTTWTWVYKGNQLTIYSVMASQPAWFHTFELNFRDATSARVWFTYFRSVGAGAMPSILPPCAEHITLSETTICWMQKTDRNVHVKTRTALSDSWSDLFGKYKNMEINPDPSYLAVTSTSMLPYLRITQDGRDLVMERKVSAEDPGTTISRIYQFSSETEAGIWYAAWNNHLKGRIHGNFSQGN